MRWIANRLGRKTVVEEIMNLKIDKDKIALVAIEAAKKRQEQLDREQTEARNNGKVQSDGKVPEIAERIMAIARSTMQKRRDYDAWARTQRLKHCPIHGRDTTIDFATGFELSKSLPKEQWVAIHHECPKCERDSQTGWLRLAGVQSIMLHCTLDNWQPTTLEDKTNLATVWQFVRKRAGFLFITGKDLGTGKTHLAIGVMRELRCGMFRTQLEFFREYSKRFQPNQTDILERAKDARLLVVDDFGLKNMSKDSDVGTLHTLFDYRHGEKLPTIITSNESYDDICRDIGARMADRLEESLFAAIELRGKSRRPTNRAKYGFSKNKN